MRTVLALALLAAPLAAAPSDPNQDRRAALQAEVEDFGAPGWNRWVEAFPTTSGPFEPDAGPAVSEYRARLVTLGEWTGGAVWHQMGTIALARPGRPTERLGVNVFLPSAAARGVVAFVHGYMSHAANFAYTASWFTARGWAVVTLDLPGHGFSTGARADVDSFATYGDAVTTWARWIESQGWPGPRVLLAHSLGSAATLEALRRPGAPRFDRIVFCAPLLRPDWFPALSLAESLTSWIKEVPSTFGWDGYLDGYAMPVHWFRALKDWLGGLEGQGGLSLPLTIYQGDRDSVVDEGWNLAEYRRLVPGVRVNLLPGKDHLFLSDKADREAFHRRLSDDLGL